MSGTGKTLAALAGAPILLAIAAWFDTVFLRDALRDAAATFDHSGSSAVLVLGCLLVAGSALTVWILAWRARSVAVGLTYAIVGGFLAALPWIVLVQTNDMPPILPEPILTVVSEFFVRTSGSLNAVGTIGAAMLIAGVLTLVRRQHERAVARRSVTDRASVASEAYATEPSARAAVDAVNSVAPSAPVVRR
jgi:hypothetical protein